MEGNVEFQISRLYLKLDFWRQLTQSRRFLTVDYELTIVAIFVLVHLPWWKKRLVEPAVRKVACFYKIHPNDILAIKQLWREFNLLCILTVITLNGMSVTCVLSSSLSHSGLIRSGHIIPLLALTGPVIIICFHSFYSVQFVLTDRSLLLFSTKVFFFF